MTLVVVHGEPIGSALALVVILGHTQGTQFGGPVSLERVGDEAVRRVDVHVALPRLLDLVLCALDLAVTQAISCVEPSADLLLHGKRQLQGHQRERLDKQLANGGIDGGAQDALARRVAQALAAAEAHIVAASWPPRRWLQCTCIRLPHNPHSARPCTEEAFQFYRSVFDGHFSGPVHRFGEMPPQPGQPPLPPDVARMVMHVALSILGGHVLMGTDAPDGFGPGYRAGNQMHLNWSPTRARRPTACSTRSAPAAR